MFTKPLSRFLLLFSLALFLFTACHRSATVSDGDGDVDGDSDSDGDSDGDGDGDGDDGQDECGDVRLPLQSDPEPIVNGSTSWDPAVVDLTEGQALAVGAIMTIYDGEWNNACTATLISPKVVLTAAHCVIDTSDPWGGMADHQPSAIRFAVGDDVSSPVHTFLVSEVHSHPNYAGLWANSAEHDIGVLVLRDDATEVLPQIQPIPANCSALNSSEIMGQAVQNVGYGYTQPYTNPWNPPPDNSTKHWTVEEVVQLSNFDILEDGFGVSAVCSGDSGGPSLWTMPDGAIRVVGTVSWGDGSCVDQDHFARVDDSCDLINSVLDGCGEVTVEGTCEDTHAVFCDGNTVMDIDCLDQGMVCGDNGSGRMRCIESEDPCGGETEEGRCDDEVALWCEDDEIQSDDCAEADEVCARTEEGLFRCIEEDPCEDLDWEGRCDGDVALWCVEGMLMVRRCDDCDQICDWDDDLEAYYCL